MKHRIQKTAVVCGVVCLALFCSVAAASARKGYVIVNNSSDQIVVVMIKQVNILGRASWRTVAHVPPGESITLPDVPEGTRLGARSASTPDMSWPPKAVSYTTVPPIFYYNLK